MNPRGDLESAPAHFVPLRRRHWLAFWRRGSRTEVVLHQAQRHRESCSRLALAKSLDMPNAVIETWSGVVAAGHAEFYRPEKFEHRRLFRLIFQDVPKRLLHDRAVWLSVALFYGLFFGMALFCAGNPGQAEKFIGPDQITQIEEMYRNPIGGEATDKLDADDSEWVGSRRNDAVMTGFYIRNNAGIGLQCFGWGIAFGVGSLYIMCSNALQLGAMFGHMVTTPYWANFSTFVTAHSAYELTAICLSAAAGLRMGYGLVETNGYSRFDSVRMSAMESLPMIGAATVLFILAAFIEGFVSASALSYSAKLGVLAVSTLSLLLFASLGFRNAGKS